ncbi:MAG: hypothetical protein J5742_01380 [Alphaproteobacteria bacterium]|nr:hypothetical protein [Alphaproteobacteria bacterium]
MKKKIPYKLGKILTLTGLMALANACNKDPIPTPDPGPTPIIPTKEITILWNWDAGVGRAPPKDTVKYYTDQDSVKFVTISLIGNDGVGFPINCSGFYPGAFHQARDSLQTRINIDSTKVKLSGSFYVLYANAPGHDWGQQEVGITPYDKEWFEKQGCRFVFPDKTR